MGLRPGHCYCKNIKKRAYTRFANKVHRKNYIGGVPGIKIRLFHMGYGQRPYTHVVHYVTAEKVQIRDNAIESGRTTIARQLNKKLTQTNYYMKVRVYPQFFLRENKQAQGAHADRIQQGMSQCPFGKVIGRASRVRVGQKIYSILVDEANVPTVVKLLERIDSKMPGKMKVVVERNVDSLKSVGTTKIRKKLAAQEEEEKVAEQQKKEATAAGKEGTKPEAGKAGASDAKAGATKSDAKAGATKSDAKSGAADAKKGKK